MKKSLDKNSETLFRALLKCVRSLREETALIREETGLVQEILFYVPFVTALLFFYFTNRLSFVYHSFGNYGFEEGFLSKTVPLVRSLLAGDFSALQYGPTGILYPLVLAVQQSLFPQDILKGALFLNVVLGTASLLIVFYLFKRVLGGRTALVSVLLLAANPAFFEFTYTACSAPLFLFLLVGGSTLLFRFLSGDGKFFSLALGSVLSGAVALVHPLGIVASLFWLALFLFRFPNSARFKKVPSVALVVLFFAVGFLPLLILLKSVHPFASPAFIPFEGNLLLSFFKNLYFRLFTAVGDSLGWLLGVFAIAGLVFLFLSRESSQIVKWYGLGLLLFLGSSLLVVDRLNSFMLLVFFVPLAVRPFVNGSLKSLMDKRAAFVLTILFTLFAVASFLRGLDSSGKMAKGEPRHLIPIAEYLRDHSTDKGTILSLHPLFAARLGFPHLGYDSTVQDWGSLLKYAKTHGVEYLLADFPEYNKFPFMRFLSNEEMVAPRGLVQLSRKEGTALYRFNFNERDENDSSTLPFRLGMLTDRYSGIMALRSDSPTRDSLAKMIRASFFNKKNAVSESPKYQVVFERKGQGFTFLGLVFVSELGGVVPANIYMPEMKAGSGLAPAVLLLPGNDKEGRLNALCRNTAENLARSGCCVLSYDIPGTGERTGFQYSHAALFQFGAAAGIPPAELFLAEARQARTLLRSFRGVNGDSVSVIGIGEDSWTALYYALLNPDVRSVACLGGLLPFEQLLIEPKAVQSFVPGLVSLTNLTGLCAALPDSSLYLVSVGPPLDAVYHDLATKSVSMDYPFVSQDRFLAGGYSSFLSSFCKRLKLTSAPLSFNPTTPDIKAMSEAGGAEQIGSMTPVLFDFIPAIRTDSLRGDGALPRIAGRIMFQLPDSVGLRRSRFRTQEERGMSLTSQMTSYKEETPETLRVYLSADGATNMKGKLTRKSIELTFAVTPPFATYQNSWYFFASDYLAGAGKGRSLLAHLQALKAQMKLPVILEAEDSLSSVAALTLAAWDSSLCNKVILKTFPGERPSEWMAPVLTGYDGVSSAEAQVVNVRNNRIAYLIYAFGNQDPLTCLEAIPDSRHRVEVWASPGESEEFSHLPALVKEREP